MQNKCLLVSRMTGIQWLAMILVFLFTFIGSSQCVGVDPCNDVWLSV